MNAKPGKSLKKVLVPAEKKRDWDRLRSLFAPVSERRPAWWIVTIFWQGENENTPLPEKYLKKKNELIVSPL